MTGLAACPDECECIVTAQIQPMTCHQANTLLSVRGKPVLLGLLALALWKSDSVDMHTACTLTGSQMQPALSIAHATADVRFDSTLKRLREKDPTASDEQLNNCIAKKTDTSDLCPRRGLRHDPPPAAACSCSADVAPASILHQDCHFAHAVLLRDALMPLYMDVD